MFTCVRFLFNVTELNLVDTNGPCITFNNYAFIIIWARALSVNAYGDRKRSATEATAMLLFHSLKTSHLTIIITGMRFIYIAFNRLVFHLSVLLRYF